MKKFKPNVRAHIYRWANFKTTVGRRPNFIEYLKNTTAESQTDTVSIQYVSNSILWNASRDLNVFIIQREN